MSEKLTVEIFRDSGVPKLHSEFARHAISKMPGVASYIDVLEANRRMVLHDTISSITNETRFPRFNADMNLFLTTRSIIVPEAGERQVSGVNLLSDERNLSIVNINDSLIDTDYTIRHELGHGFRLRRGDGSDGEGHCMDGDCVMKAVHNPYGNVREDRVKSHLMTLISRGETSRGSRLSKKEKIEEIKYCDRCEYALGRNAWYMFRLKNGEYTPDSWFDS